VSGLFAFLSPEPVGNFEDNNRSVKKKRKKKRRYGRQDGSLTVVVLSICKYH